MSFFVNNVELKEATFNQQKVKSIYFNTHLIQESFRWPGWANATWEDVYKLCKQKQSGDISVWPSDVVLGATKDINLSSKVAGDKIYNMRIIGIDFDAPGVITFDSTICGSSKVHYNKKGPQCENFYNYCEAKPYIKPLKKGTAAKSVSRNGNVTYTDSYVWLLSEREVGLNTYSSLSTANSTLTKAECTYGINAPYPFFNSANSRIKYYNIGGGARVYSLWWLRSIYFANIIDGYSLQIDPDGNSYYDDDNVDSSFSPCFAIG